MRGRRDDDEPSVVNTHYFVEALRLTVSPEIYPSARGIIGEQLEEMRIALVTGDSDPVVSLVGKIRRRVPNELCWEAKKSTSVRDFEEASRLRRVAAEWAVAPNYAQALAKSVPTEFIEGVLHRPRDWTAVCVVAGRA